MSILVATGFVRIDSDTTPAQKAIKAFGAIGSQALSTTMLPITAAVTAGIGAMAGAAISAGVAVGVFAQAVKPQFAAITDAASEYEKVQDAQTQADLANARAKKIAKEQGIQYGKAIQITSKMSASAKAKAQEYNSALSQSKSSADAATKAQDAYKQQLADMTPATRDTAKAFIGLKGDFKKWSDSLSGSTMPIFTDLINKLRDALPKLTPFVRQAATQIRAFVDSLGEGQAGKVFKEFGAGLQRSAGGSLKGFLDTLRNVAVGFAGILNAFMPASAQMSGGLAGLTQKFADFGAGLKHSEGFATFMSRANETGPILAQTFGELARAFGAISSAAGPLSGVGLTVLRLFAELVAAIPTPVLRLLVPAIIAVNLAMKLYAIYQGAAAAATWLFSTATGASRVQLAYQNTLLVIMWIRMKAMALATRIAAAAQLVFQLAFTSAGRQLALQIIMLGVHKVAMVASAVATGIATAATWALNAAIAVLTSPVTLVIVAIGLLVAAFVILWKRSGAFRNFWKGLWSGIKDVASAVKDWFAGPFLRFFTNTIPGAFRSVLNWVKSNWPWLLGALTGPIGLAVVWIIKNWDKVKDGASSALGAVIKFFQDLPGKVAGAVGNLGKLLWSKGKELLAGLVNGTVAVNNMLADWANWLRQSAVSALGSLARLLWDKGRDLLTGLINGAATVISTLGSWGTKLRKGLVTAVGNINRLIYTKGRDLLLGLVNGAATVISTLGSWGTKLRRTLVNVVGSINRLIYSKGQDLLNGLLNGAAAVIRTLGSWGNKLRGALTRGVGSLARLVYGRGQDLITGLINGTQSAMKGVGKWASGIKDKIVNAIKHVFGIKSPSRVMMSLGGYMMAGLLRGLLGGKDALNGAVKGMFSSPVGAAKALIKNGVDVAGFLGKNASNLFKQLFGFFSGGGGGNGVSQWRDEVQSVLKMLGQPAAYADLTLRRMNQESGGNPNIVNTWDSNWKAGHPSVGLMQVIRGTFQSYAGKFRDVGPFSYGVSTNPYANIYASMRYALAQYGSLPAAYNRAGGYALGTGGSTAGWHWVGEAGPELMRMPSGVRVRSHRDSVRQSAGSAGAVHLTVVNHGVIGSRQETENWLVSSLDQLQRKNRLPRALRGGS